MNERAASAWIRNASAWELFHLAAVFSLSWKTLDSSPSAVNFPSLSQAQLVVRATDWLHWSKLKW